MIVGERLRVLCEKKNLSRGDIEKRMGFMNHLIGVNEASCRRIRAHSTTLSISSGLVEMSNRIKSGLSSLAFSMASRPLAASPHTVNPEQLSSRARTAARMAAWSSTMRMESKRRSSGEPERSSYGAESRTLWAVHRIPV